MKLKQLERLGMGVFPTPFERMPRLQAELGGPNLFVKRDDLTGIAMGGNKIRQLNYILVEAKKRKADYVITTCGVQSNWSRQTAALAARMGMKALLVLRTAQFKAKPKIYDGNILLDHILGADVKVIDMKISEDPTPILEHEAEKLRNKGHRPYVLGPAAATSPLATAAYAYGFLEMAEQAKAEGVGLDAVFVASSAGPTQAGLTLGAKILGQKTKVIGVNVGAYPEQRMRDVMLRSSEGAAKLLGTGARVEPDDIVINSEYTGRDYGISTKDSIEALKLIARTEALIVDPVYTAKTVAALVGMTRAGEFSKKQNLCFVHTGGIPALFPYRDEFQPGR